MTERIWDKFLTERDRQVFAAAGYGAPQGFGKRPALVIVDVNYFFCGDRPEAILESIQALANPGGRDAWPADKVDQGPPGRGPADRVPGFYPPGNGRPDLWNRGSWRWKNSRSREDSPVERPRGDFAGNTIVPD